MNRFKQLHPYYSWWYSLFSLQSYGWSWEGCPLKRLRRACYAQVSVPGFRSTTASLGLVLAKYIPSVTVIGGLLVGLIAGVSSIFGVYGGSGIGLLLMIDIILQYYQTLIKEQVDELMPRLGGLLGGS